MPAQRNALAGAPNHYDKGFYTDIDWWLKNEAAVTNAGWSGLAAQLGVATQSVKVAGVKPATATGQALSYGDAVAVDEASMEIAGPWSTARRSSSWMNRSAPWARSSATSSRSRSRPRLKSIQQELGLTVIYVTQTRKRPWSCPTASRSCAKA